MDLVSCGLGLGRRSVSGKDGFVLAGGLREKIIVVIILAAMVLRTAGTLCPVWQRARPDLCRSLWGYAGPW